MELNLGWFPPSPPKWDHLCPKFTQTAMARQARSKQQTHTTAKQHLWDMVLKDQGEGKVGGVSSWPEAPRNSQALA